MSSYEKLINEIDEYSNSKLISNTTTYNTKNKDVIDIYVQLQELLKQVADIGKHRNATKSDIMKQYSLEKQIIKTIKSCPDVLKVIEKNVRVLHYANSEQYGEMNLSLIGYTSIINTAYRSSDRVFSLFEGKKYSKVMELFGQIIEKNKDIKNREIQPLKDGEPVGQHIYEIL